ncbi:hypothetical protein PR048_015947 [Dryococelus australis]|uniref:YqaJ viral recombinase domain-containing protein n=1 Tax=Dryococelus australis TaxID=614101 RepID=A0ABQ9HIJ3_9NEOP|nr:hypothetical protein PR048_015947 [Dryococelus australis]
MPRIFLLGNPLKRLLYKSNIVTPAMEYGIHNEYSTIKHFEAETGLNVDRCGIFVNFECGYLGARPRSFVREESALVEVKFVPSAKPLRLLDKKKLLFGDDIQNILKRKKMHHYFYQVQGAQNITRCQFCYFVVMTNRKVYI